MVKQNKKRIHYIISNKKNTKIQHNETNRRGKIDKGNKTEIL